MIGLCYYGWHGSVDDKGHKIIVGAVFSKVSLWFKVFLFGTCDHRMRGEQCVFFGGRMLGDFEFRAIGWVSDVLEKEGCC